MNIWPGSGSNPSGSTPFAFYDDDAQFQAEAPKLASWCAIRLGYPITNIEMLDVNFYACFEEAITEYSAQVNQFNIRNNLALVQGSRLSSLSGSLTHTYIQGSPVPLMIKLSEAYGSETGTGGNVDWKRGSVTVEPGVQDYDLDALWADVSESGNAIEIKRIYHQSTPAVSRFFDPFALTGQGYTNLIQDFGFGGYSPTAQFVLMPIYEDLLRIQGIEFNDMVRKSNFSFDIVNNKIRIFPIPQTETTLWFQYLVKQERLDQFFDSSTLSGSVSEEVISDYSNIPYDNMTFSSINSVGKQWIRKYTLALSKELLGAIRQKYATIPIPDAEVSLDGAELRSEAAAEKEMLVTQLRENLEATSRSSKMEQMSQETEYHQKMLNTIPIVPIYVG